MGGELEAILFHSCIVRCRVKFRQKTIGFRARYDVELLQN